MRILVIGGTRLVGRQIAQAAIDAGHDVTLFNRGKADPDGLPGAVAAGRRPRQRPVGADDRRVGRDDRRLRLPAAPGPIAAGDTRRPRRALHVHLDDQRVLTRRPRIRLHRDRQPRVAGVARGRRRHGGVLRPAEGRLRGGRRGTRRTGCWSSGPAMSSGLTTTPSGSHTGSARSHAGEPFDAPAADQPLQGVDGRDLGAFTVHCVEQRCTGHVQRHRAAGRPRPSARCSTRSRVPSAYRCPKCVGGPDGESEELPLSCTAGLVAR